MKYLYVKTRSVPELLAGRIPKRNIDPWLVWLLEIEEADRLAVELMALGYEVDSGTLIDIDFSGQNPDEY